MKRIPLIFLLLFIVIICVLYIPRSSSYLKPGVIKFINFNSKNDSFHIIVNRDIPANTIIHFTDSEWNGNHFGIDENDIRWNTQNHIIKKGTSIFFKNLSTTPIVTHGSIKGQLHIAAKNEAIFAYQGPERMPIKILAGIAYAPSNYGVLTNTGLIIDSTAIIYSDEKMTIID